MPGSWELVGFSLYGLSYTMPGWVRACRVLGQVSVIKVTSMHTARIVSDWLSLYTTHGRNHGSQSKSGIWDRGTPYTRSRSQVHGEPGPRSGIWDRGIPYTRSGPKCMVNRVPGGIWDRGLRSGFGTAVYCIQYIPDWGPWDRDGTVLVT